MMRRALETSKLTGLLALVISAIAFGPTTAQAEPGAFWLVNGSKLTSPLLPSVQAKNDSAQIELKAKVGLLTAEILCTQIRLVGAKLHELGRGTGKAHFEKCITKLNGVEQPLCLPKSPGAAGGLVETNALDGLLKLHNLETGTDDVYEVLPEAGETIAILELGSKCAIGNKIELKGKIFLKDCQSDLLIDQVEHLFEEFKPLTKLLFGSNAATISGSALAFLTEAHIGKTWSGHPA